MDKVPGSLLAEQHSRILFRQTDSRLRHHRRLGAGHLDSWVTSSRVQRGYQSQRLVAEYFKTHGWPYAEPAGSGRSGTDITGVIGVDVEVKARRGIKVAEAMKQLRDRYKDGVLPVAILRLDGQGEAHIADWPAIVPLHVFIDLLKAAGYDKPKFD
jgi:hypothetical protein